MTDDAPLLDTFFVDNRAGWRLAMTRRRSRGGVSGRPLLIVPGYGMNSFIFGFHPNGPPLADCLASRGLEVWTVDMRGQGRSIRARGSLRYGMGDLAVEDLGAAIGHVIAHTETGARKVDLVGCSLGTSLSFAHVACVPGAPVHALVSIAGLVSWKDAHPAVRVAFGSPRVAGMLRVKNTRTVARFMLPVLAKVAPSLLGIYLNGGSTDLSQVSRMVQTVEDPHPVINREIAEWIQRGDLVVRGVNVSRALPSMRHPYLCVIAKHDGIVMPATGRFPYDAIGSDTKKLLEIGDAETRIAHGDLFLCTGAEALVFEPIADFLTSV